MEQLSATNFAVIGKAGGDVQFLNEATVVYPTGNGLVLHDTESGAQVRATAEHNNKHAVHAQWTTP